MERGEALKRRKSIAHFKFATVMCGILLLLFLFYAGKDQVITPSITQCWKDIPGSEITREVTVSTATTADSFTKKTQVMEALDCTVLFNDTQCIKYTEKTIKNSIDIGEEVRIGPKKYLGSYLVFGDDLFYLDDAQDDLRSVCEGGRDVTIELNDRTFTISKLKKKNYFLNGAKMKCCQVRISDTQGNHADMCVAPGLCNTVFELEQFEDGQTLQSHVIDYSIPDPTRRRS